jgi:hypothetical protein
MKADRYPTTEKAEIEILGKTLAVVAKIQNLSKTGACVDWVSSNFQLTKGDLICMKVELKSLKKAHQINAEVIWAKGNRSGLQFLNGDQLMEKMLVR